MTGATFGPFLCKAVGPSVSQFGLHQFIAMLKVPPPIFPALAAMLINITLSHPIRPEPAPISLLKFLGRDHAALSGIRAADRCRGHCRMTVVNERPIQPTDRWQTNSGGEDAGRYADAMLDYGRSGLWSLGGGMKTCGINAIDHAPQVVAEWLDQLQEEVGWVDRTKVYILLRETLRALRDFLTVDEATDLATHLPLLIRAIYLEGWVPTRRPGHLRDVGIFLQRVQRPFLQDTPAVIPEVAAQAVMQVLARQISLGGFDQLGVVMWYSLQESRV